jgi:hypothetical protein
MNHTTLALVAVIAAAALVIGAFASPALADSSKTVVKQSNKQKILQSGFVNLADQDAANDICIITGANCGRAQATGGG